MAANIEGLAALVCVIYLAYWAISTIRGHRRALRADAGRPAVTLPGAGQLEGTAFALAAELNDAGHRVKWRPLARLASFDDATELPRTGEWHGECGRCGGTVTYARAGTLLEIDSPCPAARAAAS
jgi:hypothetical protein